MIYYILESLGKVRENEFCRVAGTMKLAHRLLLPWGTLSLNLISLCFSDKA